MLERFNETDPHTGTGVLIAPNAGITDVDDATLVSATITLTNRPDGDANESLSFTAPGGSGITGTYTAATGVLALSGSASKADYAAAIASIRYDNTVNPPDATDRTITVVVNDGDDDSVSRTATVQVTPLNVAPVNTVPGAQTTAEDTPKVINGISVDDVDNASLTVTLSVTNGTLSVASPGGVSFTVGDGTNDTTMTFNGTKAQLNTSLASVTYTPSVNFNGSATLTIDTTDGLLTDTDTVAITVTPVNDAPSATNLSAGETYTEDVPLNLVDIVVSDIDSATTTVTLTVSNPSVGSLSTGTSGSVTSTYVAGTGVWTASGAIADVNTLLAGVIFTPTANVNSNFTIATSVSDGVAPAVTGSKAMTGVAVNDAPTSTAPGAQTTDEDTPKAISGMTVADIDNTNLSVTLSVTNGTLTLGATSGLAFGDGDGTADTTMTFTGSVANVNAAIASVIYSPAANFFGSSLLTFTVSDGIAAPVTKTVAITVNPVNDAPTAVAHTVTTSSGIGLTITAATDTGELKEGAADVDDAFGELTVELVGPASPATATRTLTSAADGSFYVEPPGGLSGNGAVTFGFRICDDNAGDPNQCSSTQTQTIDVSGPDRWFVDDTDAAGCAAACNGSRSKPLVGLAALPGGRGTGDRVFLFSGAFAVGHTFPTGEHLVGQGATGSFDTLLGVTVPGNGTLDTRPTLGGTKPSLAGTVTLATNATLRGVAISTGASTALTEPAGATTGITVTETSLATTTGGALVLDQAAGSLQLDNVSHSGGSGVGVNVTQNSAALSFTGGTTISSGSSNAFSVTGGGTVVVTDPNAVGTAPDNTLTTTSGIALNVASASIGASDLTFTSISSNGASSGIVLNNTGSAGGLHVVGDGGGSSNGSGGTIQSSTGNGVSLTNTSEVTLAYLNVTGSGDSGIKGVTLSGFSLDRSNVTNNGNSTADDGIRLGEPSGSVVGVTGAVSIVNSSVSGNAHNNVHIRNTSGTISSLTVTGSTFNNLNDTFGANAFLYEASGTSTTTTATISGSTFQNNSPQRALEVQAHDTATIGSGSNAFTVSGSTFIDNGIQASFTQDTSGNLQFKFLNNGTAGTPMTGSILQAVNIFSSSQATGGTIVGTVSGNFIGNAAVVNSGSTQGGGISATLQGQTDATLLIDNNVIRQTNGDSRGIYVGVRGPSNPLAGSLPANTVTSDVTITNNNVIQGNTADNFGAAIVVEADNQTGSDSKSPTLRADIRNNTVPLVATRPVNGEFFNANLIYYEYTSAGSHGIGQLVDTAPASANATAQLQSTNTGTSMSGDGVADIVLIPGPIGTPP